MYPDSRQTIYMGINFVISPMPIINAQTNLKFQQSLVERGIEFTNVAFKEREIVIVREAPIRLEVKVAAINPPVIGPPVIGQLLLIAPQPGSDVQLFGKEAEAIIEAFDSTWTANKRQILSSDVTFRDLYETTFGHAFQELWEERLGQSREQLTMFGQPILGGGLRFVMQPLPDDPESAQIEVRIESYLKHTKKIWVETQFIWRQPTPPGSSMNPSKRLERVDNYVKSEVLSFIAGGSR
jgi:hypothetical protein